MFSNQIDFSPVDRADEFSAQLSEVHQLRLLRLSDAASLFALVVANRAYLKQWLSWLNTTQTLDDTRHFIRLTRERAQDNQGFAAAIIYHKAIVGVVGLNGINWRDRKSSIGYWLAESHQGKGLVTTSCKAVLAHAFDVLALNRITILCASQNVRSQAVPRRLGFVHEGQLRQAQWVYDHFVDHEIFSLLRHEWDAAL